MKKINVVVLMGGKSPEHEISIISGRQVVRSLDPKKFNVTPVAISKDGRRWIPISSSRLYSLPDPISFKGTNKEVITIKDEKPVGGINEVDEGKIDVVFVAMHGPFGEDGTVQGMLDLAGLKYTGSGVLASAVGMNKAAFRKIMQAEEISIPRYILVKKVDNISSIFKKLGRLPYFVKPVSQGSSVGMSIVRKRVDLKKALAKAFEYGNEVLVDEYIKGMEITCAILGNERLIALPLIEIVPKRGEFFDYESKYTESGSDEIVPARISKSLTKEIQEVALKVYKAVGCKGFARVDFLIKKGGKPIVLEINTIPGLTPMSLFPKAAKAAGISYQELLSRVIKLALEK